MVCAHRVVVPMNASASGDLLYPWTLKRPEGPPERPRVMSLGPMALRLGPTSAGWAAPAPRTRMICSEVI
jgi:hypothetical protein